MQINSISLNEEFRLRELYSYNILDTAPEQEFDDLVDLATQIYGCPIGAITFIDKSRQWLKAERGIGISETSRDIAFCSHTIEQSEIMIVKDAMLDSRFSDNPLVTNDPSIRFYAGAPIVSERGHNIGTVCIIDQKPRSISKEQIKGLLIISRQVSKLLELRLKNVRLQTHANNRIQDQKELIKKTMLVQEEENFYVSTELHENIAQGLAATKLYLELAEEGTSFLYLQKCKDNVAEMIDQTRLLSQKLFPSTLKNTTVKELLQPLCSQLKIDTGCRVELSCEKIEKLPFEFNTLLFRIVQEQLKNCRQHANATYVKIKIVALEGIHLLIEDNGKGINIQQFKKGYGIGKIVMLTEFYNGKVEIKKNTGGGCLLQIFIPLLKQNLPDSIKDRTITLV